MSKRYAFLIAISFISSLTLGWGGASAEEVVGPLVATTETESVTADGGVYGESVVEMTPQQLRDSSAKKDHALPTEEFWNKLAQCETAQNWQNGGRWAGGLGIMTSSSFPKASMGTWERYGGEEFAPSPDKATKAEQIIVANRIAFLGWETVHHRDKDWAARQGIPVVWNFVQRPVGLTGWGCYKSKSTGKHRMAKPKVYYYENYERVPLFQFKWSEKSHAVSDLQTLVGGVRVDGHYGEKTRAAHIEYLKKNKLPRTGVPAKPKKAKVPSMVSSVSAQSVSNQKRCPMWEDELKKYGLPVKEFSSIMWRESRCQKDAVGWNYKSGKSARDCKNHPKSSYSKCPAVRSYDSGLLQVNSSWVTVVERICKGPRGKMKVLLNPECNFMVSKYLYENGGLNHWKATSGRS